MDEAWRDLNMFWFCSVLSGRPSLLQATLGLGMPVASQDRVVWTFTVTVRFVAPSATEGELGTPGEGKIPQHYVY